MKEADIRPKEVFEKYLELSRKDGLKLNKETFITINCPSCNELGFVRQFEKNGYTYKECSNCHSLYCSPRPTKSQLDEFYFSSESSHFWSTVFFPAVKEARREKLFKPKAKQILDLIITKGLNVSSICDIGAGHGLLLEEISRIDSRKELFAVEPDKHSCSVCEEKGITTLTTTSEDASEWHNKFDLVLSFEVIEHVQEPHAFIKSFYDLTKTGGYTLITGLGYEGFDILTLQDESNAVSAPHHLNFLSVQGFEELFQKCGFSSVEVWTPGKLDVDIVMNTIKDSAFLEAVQRRGQEAIIDLQNFLVKHKLSSHTWVLARKS